MAATSLVLCRDPEVIGVLRPLLDRFGLSAEVCAERADAEALLGARKYNPVIVDCEQREDASHLLRWVRASESNRDSIALGLIDTADHLKDAFSMGANLVLRKPIALDEAERILRTASSLVTRMRRRFLRQVVHTLAYAKLDGLEDISMILDVGEGGLAVQTLEPLEQRSSYSLTFTLPDAEDAFEAVAAVAWADESGRAGLRFLGMSTGTRERLRAWLSGHGAVGPVEAPAQPAREHHFLLQISPPAERALAVGCDLAIVTLAVALFGAIAIAFVQQFPPTDWLGAGALLVGCGCWMLYRHAFFAGVTRTPGVRLARALAESYIAWQEKRQLAFSN